MLVGTSSNKKESIQGLKGMSGSVFLSFFVNVASSILICSVAASTAATTSAKNVECEYLGYA